MKRFAVVSFVIVGTFAGLSIAGCSSSSTADSGSGTDAGTSTSDSSTADSATSSDSGASTTIAAARSGNVTTSITVQAVVTALHGSPGDYSQWYVEDQTEDPARA